MSEKQEHFRTAHASNQDKKSFTALPEGVKRACKHPTNSLILSRVKNIRVLTKRVIMQSPIISKILSLFDERGDAMYGESVTQIEHALQAGLEAERQGAEQLDCRGCAARYRAHPAPPPRGLPEQGVDDRHEELGQRFLARYFAPEVVAAVRMHVEAKRYLCAVEETYHAALSPASQRSLELQGGAMSLAEVEAFRAEPYLETAIALRRWDDLAKIPGLPTPDLIHFIPHLEHALLGRSGRLQGAN